MYICYLQALWSFLKRLVGCSKRLILIMYEYFFCNLHVPLHSKSLLYDDGLMISLPTEIVKFRKGVFFLFFFIFIFGWGSITKKRTTLFCFFYFYFLNTNLVIFFDLFIIYI